MSDSLKNVTMGLIQFSSQVGDKEANVEEAVEAIEKCARRGARLVALPELWDVGYLAGDLIPSLAETTAGPLPRLLSETAKRLDIYLLGGTIAEKGPGGKIFNTALLFDSQGNLLLKHRKVHLYTRYEKRWFTPGKNFKVVSTDLGSMGIMVCYDGDFPEVPRLLCLKGAELLLHPSAYPEPFDRDWRILYEANARANGVYVVGINHGGYEPGEHTLGFYPKGVDFVGQSQVIDPRGQVLFRAPRSTEKTSCFTVTVDLESVQKVRMGDDHYLKDRVPESYVGLSTRRKQSRSR